MIFPRVAVVSLGAFMTFVSPEVDPVRRDIQEIFENGRYAFCDATSNEVAMGRERDWCPLVGASNNLCPGFPDACRREPDSNFAPAGEPSSGKGRDQVGKANAGPDSGSGSDSGPSPDETPVPPEPYVLEVPSMSGFARVLLWLLIAAAIGGVIYLIARNIMRGRSHDESDSDLEDDGDTGDEGKRVASTAGKATGPAETDVDRLLRRAREAAARGDYETGVGDAYAALLRRLESAGKIEVLPWRTNGDYVTDLRGTGELRQQVRSIVRDVERVQFGGLPADQPTFQRVIDTVVSVVRKATFVAVLGIGLSASACDEGESSGLAGLGYHPHGSRAVAELLRRNDVDAHHRVRTLEQLSQTHGAIVLLGDAEPIAQEWSILLRWVDEGGHLVVALNTALLPDTLELDFDVRASGSDVTQMRSLGANVVEHVNVPAAAALTDIPDYGPTVLLERPPAEPSAEVGYDEWGNEIDPFAALDPFEAYAVRHYRGEGTIDVFADDLLFTNAAVAIDDNGAFLLDYSRNIVRAGGEVGEGEIEIVTSLTGGGAQDPLEALSRAFLTPLFLQILAFLGLLYLWRGMAFAQLRDPPEKSRRAFVDHVRSLGMRYARARAARHVARLYAHWAMERLRERVPRGSSRGLHGLAQALALRTAGDETRIMRLLLAAHELREGNTPSDYRPEMSLSGTAHPKPDSSEGGGSTFMGLSPRGHGDFKADLQIVRDLTRLLRKTQGNR